MRLQKPDRYEEFLNSEIPQKDWPEDCLKFHKSVKKFQCRYPETKTMSIDELQEFREKKYQEHLLKLAENMRKVTSSYSPEKIAEINKKKGSYYNNMTPEEKIEFNKELKKRSQKFWDGMNEEERKAFAQYRETFVSEEEKEIRLKKWQQGAEKWKKEHPEEAYKQAMYAHQKYTEKFNNDEEFRNKQITLLRKHNEEYFAKMTKEERSEWSRQNILARIKNLSDEDKKKFRDRLQAAYCRYMESLTPEEKGEMQHNNKFNSKFEKRFRESILSNSFYYEKEYTVSNEHGIKYWDYAIFEIQTNTLVMVIDLDGCYFHADKCDYNGMHSREERDEKRGLFIPPEAKCYIIPEKEFNKAFTEIMSLLIKNYDEYLKYLFKEMRSMSFPYPEYSNDRLIDSFHSIRKVKLDDFKTRPRQGDALIYQFHKSIWHANVYGEISPYEAWNNDKMLMKCIQNRTIFQTHINPNKILQGFNISKIAPKVTVFSAARAYQIIIKYLNDYQTIFDPFSGFSGRMLGALSCGKTYIGYDISPIHVRESNEMIGYLEAKHLIQNELDYPTIKCRDSTKEYGRYPALFTCPPYGLKEQWDGINLISHTCDEWIDICLSNFKCKRYVFVVDKTIKYQNHVADVINNKSHFAESHEYLVII